MSRGVAVDVADGADRLPWVSTATSEYPYATSLVRPVSVKAVPVPVAISTPSRSTR